MVDTRVTLCGIGLDNPVIPAGGCFGYGHDFAAFYDIDCLGSFACRGTTLAPCRGDPTPRIAEASSGMLSAAGLQNPGVDAVIAEELPRLAAVFHKPMIANVGGFSVEEYVETCRRFDACPQVGWIELNLSCPDDNGAGLCFGADPVRASELTAAVREAVQKPLIVKLTPGGCDIAAIAKAAEAAGADALSLINAPPAMRIDLKTRRPLLARGTGGLSGPAIFPLALRTVYEVYEAVEVPILGGGGVSSARDVLEMMLAGATAVQVGAMNLVRPTVCREIIEELPAVMTAYGIRSLSEIVGAAHRG